VATDSISIGDIVQEVNYIAYFHKYSKPLKGIVIKIYEAPKKSWEKRSNRIAKVYWFKNRKFEILPLYLLALCEQEKEYECEKI
jgi:hypothetical protein